MKSEWDEAKRIKTIEKQKLDCRDAARLFAGRYLRGEARVTKDERRLMATGLLEGFYITVVYTERFDRLRIITMRRARDDEQGRYEALQGRYEALYGG